MKVVFLNIKMTNPVWHMVARSLHYLPLLQVLVFRGKKSINEVFPPNLYHALMMNPKRLKRFETSGYYLPRLCSACFYRRAAAGLVADKIVQHNEFGLVRPLNIRFLLAIAEKQLITKAINISKFSLWKQLDYQLGQEGIRFLRISTPFILHTNFLYC